MFKKQQENLQRLMAEQTLASMLEQQLASVHYLHI